jgi:hypothetical protein
MGQTPTSTLITGTSALPPMSGHRQPGRSGPKSAKPGHRDRFTRSPRRHEQAAYWHRFGKKGDPDKLHEMQSYCRNHSERKRYITVRFDEWISDERRALHSATSLARQNASPLARSPRYSVARIGGCCVGHGGTDLLARVTGASAFEAARLGSAHKRTVRYFRFRNR